MFNQQKRPKTLVGLFSILVLIKLFMTFYLSPGDDEAYYWVWSQTALFGFYDHPPMVSWAIGLFSWILGDHLVAIRLPTFIVYLMSFWILAKTSHSSGLYLRSSHTYFLALTFLSIPILYVGSILTTPDPFFLFVWVASFYWFVSRIHLDTIRNRDWFFLGVLFGLGGLTKITILILGLSFTVSLLLVRPEIFKRRGPWMTLLIFCAIFSTYLFWNHSHGWASFQFHLSERHSPSFNIGRGFSWLLIQFIVLGITFGYLIFRSVIKDIVQFRLNRASRIRLCFFIPIFCLFWYQSFWSEFKIHWALPAYFPYLSPLAHQISKMSSKWRVFVCAVPMTLTLFLAAQIIYPVYPLLVGNASSYISKEDPGNDVVGWDEFAQYLKQEYGESIKKGETLLASHRYQTASQLWYSMRTPTYSLNPSLDHFDFVGYGKLPEAVYSLIYVGTDKYRRNPVELLENQFECSEERAFETFRFSVPARTFYYWICKIKRMTN